ncbi:TolC family outer membrane protein [Magnetospirillum sp. UT-4]|uniref:TolC family outer membrane protein n=1 Tax=Magnetospirillum sp. UT-4 TaxID=2681467 RepID=UPI0020C250B8|nr:TolC family outer membrane protein [Magnetospirillum sp. UT-4]
MSVAMAGTARAETLEDVLVSAYTTNPSLLARRAQLKATDEGVPQALSNWRPTVTFTGEYGRGRYETNANTSASAQGREQGRTSRSNTLTISQPLYRGGRTVAATRAAEADVLANRADLQVREQTVLLNAATAFLDVARDETVLQLNINNEQVLRRQLEAAQERFRVGEITRTDVSQADARLSGATADRVSAEGILQNSRARYITVVGRAPESPQAPKSAAAVPGSFDEVKEVTLAKNPSVIFADWTAQSAKDGIDTIAGELLPTVNLNGEWGRNLSATSQGSESETLEATVSVSVPLYEGGDVYSRVRAQKHTYGRRKIEADQARRDALEDATQGWEDLHAARARIRSIESQIRASELALAGVEEEAKVGSRTVLDVLDAEQELFNARVNLVRAQRDEMVAAFTLKSALGQMTAEALTLPVEIYDPTRHYEDVRDKWIGTGVDVKYEE